MYELREMEIGGCQFTAIVVDGEEFPYTGSADDESVQKEGAEIARAVGRETLYFDGVTLAALELGLDADDGQGLEDIHAAAYWMKDLELDLDADAVSGLAKRIFSNRTFFNYVLAAVHELAVVEGGHSDHGFIHGGPLDVGLQKALEMSRAIRNYI